MDLLDTGGRKACDVAGDAQGVICGCYHMAIPLPDQQLGRSWRRQDRIHTRRVCEEGLDPQHGTEPGPAQPRGAQGSQGPRHPWQ